MAYGNAQRLGETIDPRLMQADFSGFERAGQITGNAYAQIGADVGGMIKQKAENERRIKKAEQMAKSIRDAIPELAEMGNNALTELSNPDLTTNQKLAIAAGIEDSLRIGVLGLGFKQDAADRDFRERQFGSELGMRQREMELRAMGSQADLPVIMDANQLNEQIQTGAKVDYVPLGNGLYKVEKATANATPLVAMPYQDENGVWRNASSGGGTIQVPAGGGESIQNALPPSAGGNYPSDANAAFMSDAEIQQLVAQTPQVAGVDVDGGMGVLPPRPQAGGNIAAQQIQQAQQVAPPSAAIPKENWVMKDGTWGVTRPAGSTSELDYKLKEQQLKETAAKTAQAQAAVSKDLTAEEKAAQQAASKTNFIIDKANEAEAIIKKDLADYGAGSIVDMGKARIPGTAAYSLQNQVLPALKDAIALDNLRQLKATSPTGSSGMGSLTEKEGQRLENAYGKLDVGGDKNILLKDIARLKEEVFNAVHGSKAERAKAIKEGKITQDQNNQVEQMYNEQILGLKSGSAGNQPANGLFIEDEQLRKDLEEFRKRQNK